MKTPRISLLLAGAMAVGCGISNTSGQGSSSPGDLSGVWDGAGTLYGARASYVTVTIDRNHFKVENAKGVLTALADGDSFWVTWQRAGAPLSTFWLERMAPSAFSLGAFPIDLSGDWAAVGDSANADTACIASLGPDVSGACLNVGSKSQLPRWLPDPSNGAFAGKRTSTAASVFGDLGGSWQIAFSGGGTCNASFVGGSVDLACGDDPRLGFGSLHVDVMGSTLSGYTSNGIEFSAQRR
jgi:hypothetical protein